MAVAFDILARVNEFVSPTYLVGGAVRDHVLGISPVDFDFATPLSPDEVEAQIVAAGRRPHKAGKRFGTLGFRLEGQVVEVTTFRSECYEDGNRKPAVFFVDNITEDLSRRDFTMNAMAISPKRKLIDPFGGRDDLEHLLIKAVGNPTLRFKEDPLRMLRACRFAAQLGFTLDAETAERARRKAYHILDVSRERWVAEMDKLLLARLPSIGLLYLARLELLKFMLPELFLQVGYDQRTPYHDYTLWGHTMNVVACAPPDIELRWAALLHDVGKPFVAKSKGKTFTRECYPRRDVTEEVEHYTYLHHDMVGAELVKRISRCLKWSNARHENVVALVRDHLREDSPLRVADSGAQKRQPAQ